MNRKQEQMLRILMEADDCLTASVLAEKMNVSVRSIRNYAAELSSEYPELLFSSVKGYRVNREKAKHLLGKNNRGIPQNNKERAVYLAALLLRTAERQDFHAICEDLLVNQHFSLF